MLSIRDTLKIKCRELNIEKPNKISKKAAELHRMLDLRCRTGTPINEFSKPYICIDLACRWFKMPFPKDRAVAMSSITLKDYQSSLIIAQNLLDLKSGVSVEDLCAQYGISSTSQIQAIDDILDEYKRRFIETLPEQRRRHADFSNPSFRCVAFFVKCKEYGTKVEKSTLCDHCDVSVSEFDAVLSNFVSLMQMEHMFPSEENRKAKSPRPKDKKKGTIASATTATTQLFPSPVTSPIAPERDAASSHSPLGSIQRAPRGNRHDYGKKRQRDDDDIEDEAKIQQLFEMDIDRLSPSPQSPPLRNVRKKQKTISSYFTAADTKR